MKNKTGRPKKTKFYYEDEWHMFLRRHKGQGLYINEISKLYKEEKERNKKNKKKKVDNKIILHKINNVEEEKTKKIYKNIAEMFD